MKRICLLLGICLMLATPSFAQVEVVSAVKNDLIARGVSLSGSCGAFEITKRVAWVLRAQGIGLLSKPGGNNCQGYSIDVLTRMDGSGIDILGDSGGSNVPGWNESEPPGSLSGRWVAPFDPADAPAPGPSPTPIPTPAPPQSLDEILQRIKVIEQATADIRQQNLEHETAEAAERKAAGEFREQVKSAWRDRFVFVGKYIAPLIGGIMAGWKLQ